MAKVNLSESFRGAINAQQIPALEQKVAELEEKLESAQQKQGIIEISLDQIHPNPQQPRQSFYVVQRLQLSLAEEGQKEPILLVSRPEGGYLIFDGECRWRSAKNLGWQKIKAVVLDYDATSFDKDVLTAAIQKSTLNALDLAEALVERICQLETELEPERVATVLNTVLTRLKRKGLTKKLVGLLDAEAKNQVAVLKSLELAELEITICATLLSYGLNPSSVSTNLFPMLKLEADLKSAIRQRGLGDAQAKLIDKIRAKKLDLTEAKAKKLRGKLIDKVLNEQLSRTATAEEVKATIATITPQKEPIISGPVRSLINSARKITVMELSSQEREELVAVLKESLAQLENS